METNRPYPPMSDWRSSKPRPEWLEDSPTRRAETSALGIWRRSTKSCATSGMNPIQNTIMLRDALLRTFISTRSRRRITERCRRPASAIRDTAGQTSGDEWFMAPTISRRFLLMLSAINFHPDMSCTSIVPPSLSITKYPKPTCKLYNSKNFEAR